MFNRLHRLRHIDAVARSLFDRINVINITVGLGKVLSTTCIALFPFFWFHFVHQKLSKKNRPFESILSHSQTLSLTLTLPRYPWLNTIEQPSPTEMFIILCSSLHDKKRRICTSKVKKGKENRKIPWEISRRLRWRLKLEQAEMKYRNLVFAQYSVSFSLGWFVFWPILK